jgi:hypothetical protein
MHVCVCVVVSQASALPLQACPALCSHKPCRRVQQHSAIMKATAGKSGLMRLPSLTVCFMQHVWRMLDSMQEYRSVTVRMNAAYILHCRHHSSYVAKPLSAWHAPDTYSAVIGSDTWSIALTRKELVDFIQARHASSSGCPRSTRSACA